MVVVWVKVWGCFLGCRAIAFLCLCRSVESSSYVFTVIGYDDYIRKMMRFRWRVGSGESDGRSWRSLMISSGVVSIEVGRSRCRDRERSVAIGVDRSVQEGSGRLDLMLRSSPKRSRDQILVS